MSPLDLPLRLAGARVIDPHTGTDTVSDAYVDVDGVHLRPPAGAAEWPVVPLEGRVVAPAFVEIHAHLREPGGEASETISSGLAAARAGGYGTVLAMANTRPVNDDPAVTRRMLAAAEQSGTGVRLMPVSAATRGLAGEDPAPWADQIAAGCAAISDDGKPVANHALLAGVLEACEELGVRYLSHAEVPELFGGYVNLGPASEALGVPGIPAACESEAVRAEIAVAEHVGAAIHFCHVSTRESVALIRAAQERGARVTAEAAPHHLLLHDDLFLERGPDTGLKMNPPLRGDEDAAAVRTALREGAFAAVATDHAPHAPELKCRSLAEAPFGVIGMENAFAVLHEHLVRREGWPLALLLERFTSGPAACVGIRAGRLFEGPPSVAVIDPGAAWEIQAETFRSRSRNCPFEGWAGRGRVTGILLAGRLAPLEAGSAL